MACRIYIVSPSPIPFPLDFGFWILELDFGPGFGIWISDLDLGMDLGLTKILTQLVTILSGFQIILIVYIEHRCI